MKKAISILILATILLNSCSQENPLGTQNEQPPDFVTIKAAIL